MPIIMGIYSNTLDWSLNHHPTGGRDHFHHLPPQRLRFAGKVVGRKSTKIFLPNGGERWWFSSHGIESVKNHKNNTKKKKRRGKKTSIRGHYVIYVTNPNIANHYEQITQNCHTCSACLPQMDRIQWPLSHPWKNYPVILRILGFKK